MTGGLPGIVPTFTALAPSLGFIISPDLCLPALFRGRDLVSALRLQVADARLRPRLQQEPRARAIHPGLPRMVPGRSGFVPVLGRLLPVVLLVPNYSRRPQVLHNGLSTTSSTASQRTPPTAASLSQRPHSKLLPQQPLSLDGLSFSTASQQTPPTTPLSLDSLTANSSHSGLSLSTVSERTPPTAASLSLDGPSQRPLPFDGLRTLGFPQWPLDSQPSSPAVPAFLNGLGSIIQVSSAFRVISPDSSHDPIPVLCSQSFPHAYMTLNDPQSLEVKIRRLHA